VTLPYGTGEVDAILFDLDDVLVPFETPASWQWAWRPQGPVLGERKVRAAVRRSLKAWDRRRWLGLTGKEPPADVEALRRHLAQTLDAIAGHSVRSEESDAVVRRILRPAGEVERFSDVGPMLARLRERAVRVGVLAELPQESARWMLHRSGLDDVPLLAAADGDGPHPPMRDAFRAAAERLGSSTERTVFVGDLYWSDVRAAGRAGLPSVLLDRHDAWPKVQHGRMLGLDALETTLARGPSLTEPEEPDESDGASES
jgi:FMN phosphatase YigB (HAD superfamily)